MVKRYELPDETLQLIAASPEFAVPMMMQGGEAQFSTPDVRRSDLISALRSISGPGNPGFTRYANAKNGAALDYTKRNYRGANNPAVLAMKKYVAPDVVLPGGETDIVIDTPVFDKLIYDDIVDDEVIDDEVIDDDIVDDDIVDDDVVDEDLVDDVVVDDIIKDEVIGDTIVDGDGDGTLITDGDGTVITDGGGTVISDGTVVTDGGTGGNTVVDDSGTSTVVGGTGADTAGGGGDSIRSAIESAVGSVNGTSGSGVSDATVGGTTGATNTDTTSTTVGGGSTTTGTGDALRDAIIAAVDGAGASIDNSLAGLDMSAAANTPGAGLPTDQIDLTKPKVPNVTLEVGNGLTLDDGGSTSMTFDYPELLSPDELAAYDAWLATQNPGGTTGGGKAIFDETWGSLEF